MELLTVNNSKALKSLEKGWQSVFLHLLPHKLNSFGKNLCPDASPLCAESCLNFAGNGSFLSVQRARENRTKFFFEDREGFMAQLCAEIRLAAVRAEKKGLKLCVRLNATSDLPWENIRNKAGQTVFEMLPDIQFYDYTKTFKRMGSDIPNNYHLTFSRSEINDEESFKVLKSGANVAIVFSKLPENYKGFTVINGDSDDLRFLDQQNVVVGLTYKTPVLKGFTKEKERNNAFVVKEVLN